MKVINEFDVGHLKVLEMDNGDFYLIADVLRASNAYQPTRVILKVDKEKVIYNQNNINKNANKLKW